MFILAPHECLHPEPAGCYGVEGENKGNGEGIGPGGHRTDTTSHRGAREVVSSSALEPTDSNSPSTTLGLLHTVLPLLHSTSRSLNFGAHQITRNH